jgi:hypothetical protein
MKSMSLKGGIETYTKDGRRYLNNELPEGRKVFYNDTNGMDYDQKRARDYFKKGDELTIKEIYVGKSSSKVEFIEFPDIKFNTVMFSDVEERLNILFA